MKNVSRSRMPHHRDRADALFRTMVLIENDPEYAAAVPLLAVHSAISLADAVLVGCVGRRGNDTNHTESFNELRKLCKERNRLADGLTHLRWLLSRKSQLSYGDTQMDKDDDINGSLLHATRFASWAYREFPEIARTERHAGARQ